MGRGGRARQHNSRLFLLWSFVLPVKSAKQQLHQDLVKPSLLRWSDSTFSCPAEGTLCGAPGFNNSTMSTRHTFEFFHIAGVSKTWNSSMSLVFTCSADELHWHELGRGVNNLSLILQVWYDELMSGLENKKYLQITRQERTWMLKL